MAAFVYSSAGPVPLPDQPGTSQDRATQLALGLYVAYKLAATVASVLAGRLGDRRGAVLILAPSGSGCSGWPMLASPPAHQRPGPGPWFVAAGVAIGCVGTAEHAAVAALAPVELRGSAFGLLAAVQSFGNLAASAVAGLLWTDVSPQAAFAYLVVWMGGPECGCGSRGCLEGIASGSGMARRARLAISEGR